MASEVESSDRCGLPRTPFMASEVDKKQLRNFKTYHQLIEFNLTGRGGSCRKMFSSSVNKLSRGPSRHKLLVGSIQARSLRAAHKVPSLC